MIYRIYALTEPDGETPRYVGQTSGYLHARMTSHLRARGRSRRAEWIRSLLDQDQQPTMLLLEEIEGTRHDAYRAETRWIHTLRLDGADLVNVP